MAGRVSGRGLHAHRWGPWRWGVITRWRRCVKSESVSKAENVLLFILLLLLLLLSSLDFLHSDTSSPPCVN
jgi:hypothetical protein